MKQKYRRLLRAAVFLLLLGIAVWGLQGVFGLDSVRSYDSEKGYVRETKGSLDAVYIGASDVHAFWQPLFGWNERGIAVWNYAIDSMPMIAVKNVVIEARKTQPQALMIINLNTFKKESVNGDMVHIHRVVDYQPFSLNKVRLVNRMTEGTDISGLDKLEFYFPIIRFHSRWDDLDSWAFDVIKTDYKSSKHTANFRGNVEDQRSAFLQSEERTALPEDVSDLMLELLDYCDAEGVQTLFVKSTQVGDPDELARMNTLEDMVVERGYPCLDLIDRIEEVGIDLQYDYYNSRHTNVHGSMKYSHFFAAYLAEHYGFRDKRGLPGWESWDKAAVKYMNYVAAYILPFELETGNRDIRLESPELQSLEAGDDSMTLSWSASDGAQGYEIYRIIKNQEKTWSLLARVDSGTLTYTDEGLSAQTEYAYTVVPCRQTPEGTLYGNFNVNGVSAKTGG